MTQHCVETWAGECRTLRFQGNLHPSVLQKALTNHLLPDAHWFRSGETEDDFIADLAVGLSTGQIKTGAPCR